MDPLPSIVNELPSAVTAATDTAVNYNNPCSIPSSGEQNDTEHNMKQNNTMNDVTKINTMLSGHIEDPRSADRAIHPQLTASSSPSELPQVTRPVHRTNTIDPEMTSMKNVTSTTSINPEDHNICLRNFIGGTWLECSTTLPLYNPATNKEIARIPRSTKTEVEQAVSAASAAFPTWSKTSISYRANLLNAIADGIEASKELLARLESEDSGKTLKMASTIDIPRAVANFRFFAGQVQHDFTEAHMMHDAINYSIRTPVGIFGLITPWNLPLYLLSWKVAPALAMGNCIIAKPSELTPRTASVLADIIHKAGVPAGVFNLIQGYGGEAGQAIIEHPKIKGISFTGGTSTGAIVARTAAPLFKKLSLELGGKNSTIVFGDCDLEKTVTGAVRAAFTNSGQVCLAGSRILVEETIYDTFVSKFVESVRKLRVGDPMSADTDLGPVSSKEHCEKVRSYIEHAVNVEGGTVLCGGIETPMYLEEPYRQGAFVAPTVIVNVPPTSRISVEEVFGPVVTIHPFATEADAVSYANCVRYGLAGSVWTSDITRAHRLGRLIESGILWINCWLHRDLRTPFGGVKDSGIGREGGRHSLEFYSEYRNVCVYTG